MSISFILRLFQFMMFFEVIINSYSDYQNYQLCIKFEDFIMEITKHFN